MFDEGLRGSVNQAREVLPRIRDEYERMCYTGLICERRAKAVLRQGGPESGSKAYELLHEARSWYEKAEVIRPAGNDDTLLCWNACARLEMRNRHVAPARQERQVAYRD